MQFKTTLKTETSKKPKLSEKTVLEENNNELYTMYS